MVRVSLPKIKRNLFMGGGGGGGGSKVSSRDFLCRLSRSLLLCFFRRLQSNPSTRNTSYSGSMLSSLVPDSATSSITSDRFMRKVSFSDPVFSGVTGQTRQLLELVVCHWHSDEVTFDFRVLLLLS